MKLSRRSWHMRLGQWLIEGGWLGRWLDRRLPDALSEKRKVYKPKTLCDHFWSLALGVPLVLILIVELGAIVWTLWLVFRLVTAIFGPVSRGVVATARFAKRRTAGTSTVFQAPSAAVKRSAIFALIHAAYQRACPLIEVED